MCIESIHVLSPDTMPSLTAQLACLRTAISYHHQISLVDTYIDTISTAISHKDEQVHSYEYSLACCLSNLSVILPGGVVGICTVV